VATMAFDSLRFARRLTEAGVPERQAEAQAELMAEAFGFYASNIVTRDYLDAVLRAEFKEQEHRFERIDARFDRMEARFEQIDRRFEKMEARFDQIDHRFEQMEARFEQIDRRFEQMEARFEQIDRRFELIDGSLEKIDGRFDKMDRRFLQLDSLRTQSTLHSFMLGLIVLVQVVPQLQAWFAT